MAALTFTSGMQLLRAKNYEAVYNQSIAALRTDEKNPLAFFLLGVLASDTGSHDKALEFFAKSCEHEPKNVHYQTYYAKALLARGQNVQAKTHADLAASIGTNDALISDMIGVVYSRTGYHERAIPFFEKAVKKNPRWANFHFNLGASAEFIGDFKTAKAAYKNTLSVNPKFYLAWFSLVSLEKQNADNNQLEALKALFEGTNGDADARLLIGHAIAKTLEDLEQYQESFDWLVKAKAAKKTQIAYTKHQSAQLFEAAKSMTQTNAARSNHDLSPNSHPRPIFVVGLPRTGTTLLDRILSSHPQVRSVGELNTFSHLLSSAVGAPLNNGLNADVILEAGQIDLSNVGKNYMAEMNSLASGAAVLISKMPFNFLYAGLIARALPQAKIITVRRGAMDSCLSNYRQIFAAHDNKHDYSYDLEDTAAFYREFDELIAHWRKIISPERFMEVAYEDIVFEQKTQTRRLLEFCELDWDDACMRFHENNAPVDTASAVQVRQALYTGSIGRWEKYGDRLAGLKRALGPLSE